MTALGRAPRLPLAVPAAIAAAWLVAIAAQAGGGPALHHDAPAGGGAPLAAGLVLFVIAWQAMTAAMMLPSSLPLVRLFAAASARQPLPRATMVAFLMGYAYVWSAFGIAAFLGDVGLDHLTHEVAWLHERPWAIAGGALALAGVFQFTSLKERCLRECRRPESFMARHYGHGLGAAFGLGRRHGLFCVGCCWALMLVMFAAGMASLPWMAALTALMVVEKAVPGGHRAVPLAGIVLLAWAGLVLAHPGWLPGALAGPS
jgi:predicted metal-binding membrane protein